MSIQINLLSEALAEEDLRRRDPVKRSIYLGAFLVALSLVWFSSTWLGHIVDSSKLSQIQAEIQDHTNDYGAVVINLKKITDTQKKLTELQKLSADRFLQGNLLNALQQLYVPNVNLTRLTINQSYAALDTKPPGVREHIVLTLDAKDASSNPGDGVNQFKDSLSAQAYFKSSLTTNNAISLLNLSPPESSAGSKPFVVFSLECHFPDTTR